MSSGLYCWGVVDPEDNSFPFTHDRVVPRHRADCICGWRDPRAVCIKSCRSFASPDYTTVLARVLIGRRDSGDLPPTLRDIASRKQGVHHSHCAAERELNTLPRITPPIRLPCENHRAGLSLSAERRQSGNGGTLAWEKRRASGVKMNINAARLWRDCRS